MMMYRLLRDLLAGTTGFAWIQDFDRSQNGRSAWLALIEHYNNRAQKEKRKSTALATICLLHYKKNESVFSYEDYSCRMLLAFRDLEETDEGLTKINQVKILLDKLMPRSLLNQNQIRAHIQHESGRVQDYFTRNDNEFGITIGTTFIQFHLEGAAVFFVSHVQSIREIEELPCVVLMGKKNLGIHGNSPFHMCRLRRRIWGNTMNLTTSSSKYHPPW